MGMAQGTVIIDQVRCKGCQLCVNFCPQHVLVMEELQLNAKGYHPAKLDEADSHCTGCAICALVCPDACFTVFRATVPSRQPEYS